MSDTGDGPGGPVATVDRRASLRADAWRQLRRNPVFVVAGTLVLVMAVMAVWPGLFTSADPRQCDLANFLERPSREHVFGYDAQGCDYYARVVHGARVSMTVGLTVTVFAGVIAVVLGSVAGYYGGVLDTLIARLTDVWFAIPVVLGGVVVLGVLRDPDPEGHFLIAALVAFFDLVDGLVDVDGLGRVVFVLVLLGWPTMLRLMRSSVLSVRETEYVEAARALGASDLRIVSRHILPNAIAPLVVYATISVGIIVAAEATLSFLGVGLQLPAISWGLMISTAQSRILQAPHLLLFPGLFLSVTVLSFILLGDALRDALDPKLR